MRIKVHNSDGKAVVAVCDSDIFGKSFEDGDLCLDLSSDFFDGEEMGEDKISEIVKKAYVVNMCGEKSVALGKKLCIVDQDNVKKISDIPYAQTISLDE